MEPVINLRRDGIPLSGFQDKPRWVTWRDQPRNGKLTKVPFCPHENEAEAKSNDPTTWGVYEQAVRHATTLPRCRGVGIVLGQFDEEWCLGGIDLDACRDPTTGQLSKWAEDILRTFKTYGEVSPSGTGVKAFFLYRASLMDQFRAFMDGAKHSKIWRRGTDEHGEAIELHFSNRYFTTTGRRVDALPTDIHRANSEDIFRLLRVIGPQFAGAASPKPAGQGSFEDAPKAEAPAGDLWKRIREKMGFHPPLMRLLNGDFSTLKDRSRSAKAMALGGALARAGFSREDVFEALRTWPETAEWTREKGDASNGREFARLWEKASKADDFASAFNAPPGEASQAPEPLWVDPLDPTTLDIPRRPWCVPGHLMRGSVTVLSGQGAGGKSSLVVAWTISAATGEKLGEFAPVAPLIVVNYNTEDDQDEQRRRYSAALLAQRKAGQVINNRVIRCGPHNVGTLFERDEHTGRIVPTHAMASLEEVCAASGADVLICDPLAELHNAEENDNTAMRAVVAAFRSMAQRLGIAILILHHDRKGTNAPGDMDRVRGASAISGAVRVMLTLTTMSAEEAERFGIPGDQRRRHFRVDGAKSNYAIATEAEWWRLTGYEIANGETVAAALPWSPPGAFDGVSMATCVAILEAMQRGINGAPFGSQGKARGELFAVLAAEPFNVPKAQASALIAAWIASGVLTESAYCKSPNSNHKRAGFVVDPQKIYEMRQEV